MNTNKKFLSFIRADSCSFVDKSLLLCLALAAVVIIPRAALISRAHSECTDDEYHLVRGIRFWTGSLRKTPLNDPPLGEFISAIPLIVSGTSGNSPSVLHGQKNSPETLLLRVAIWKAILFLPMIGVAFVWVRRIYNTRAAWLTTVLLIFEPNFAAHIHLGAVDVLGVEGIFIACYLAWRYFARPSFLRSAGLATSVAVALLLKHTAIILPVVIAIYGILWWAIRRDDQTKLPRILAHAALGLLIGCFAMWAMMRFEFARPAAPKDWMQGNHRFLRQLTNRRIPAATYVRSLLTGASHAGRGHAGYLFGEKRAGGWWYYFPVVATYKVPVGIIALMLLAIGSLKRVRPRREEWSLLVPAIAWAAFMMSSDINIGFRHFFPAYVFMLMLCGRVMLLETKWRAAAWAFCAACAVHGLVYHPDYMSYFNFPRDKPYLAINDSNIDWGQSLKQIREWIDENPPTDKSIYLRYFGRTGDIRHYVGSNVIVLETENNPPRTGLLIISPVWEAGVYDPDDKYRALRKAKPIDVIGHNMRVYDLDQVKGWRKSLGK